MYTVTPQHHASIYDGGLSAKTLHEAGAIAAQFRDQYHESVAIRRDDRIILWWRRDERGKWQRVNP